MGRAVVVALLALSACAGPGTPPPAPVHGEGAPIEVALLWRGAPIRDDLARRTLYTWTTTEQLREIARAGKLLTRGDSRAYGESFFEQYIRGHADAGDPISQLLVEPTLRASRWAWPIAWSTRSKHGGDQLIRVTLRDDAYLLALHDDWEGFHAMTMRGAPVSLDEVRAHPERIAAVYLSRSGYREYVLCSEAMIESWATGTPELAQTIARDAAALEELAHRLRESPRYHEQLVEFYGALASMWTDLVASPEKLEAQAQMLRASVQAAWGASEGGLRSSPR